MKDIGEQTGIRRSVIVATVLLIAVAVTLVAIRSWLEQSRVEDVEEQALAAAERVAILPIPEPEPVVAPAVDVPQTVAEPRPVVAPETINVIVLPVRSENHDPAAEAFMYIVRAAMLRALPGMGIEAIDVSAAEYAAFVPPSAGPLPDDKLVYLAVTHRYGGLNVAEIYEEASADSASWSIRLEVVRNNGSSTTGTSIRKFGDPRPENAPETLGIGFAGTLALNTTSPSFAGAMATNAQLTLIDPSRSDLERLRALNLIQQRGFDSTSIAAAIDLGTRSPSAGTRRAVWTALRRNAYDPVLAQPLSNALLHDADTAVRTEAARALSAYSHDPVAWSALERARQNDSSLEVKTAARMSMLDYEERQTFTRQSLLDPTLSSAERLAPTRLSDSVGLPAAEDALAYAEIATGTDDPELKVDALSALGFASMSARLGGVTRDRRIDPMITRVLIESATHQDARVRHQALTALVQQHQLTQTIPWLQTGAERLEVRALLETVMREDTALAAELSIEEALKAGTADAGPVMSPPPALNIGRALQ